jgi:hypothetical protein
LCLLIPAHFDSTRNHYQAVPFRRLVSGGIRISPSDPEKYTPVKIHASPTRVSISCGDASIDLINQLYELEGVLNYYTNG